MGCIHSSCFGSPCSYVCLRPKYPTSVRSGASDCLLVSKVLESTTCVVRQVFKRGNRQICELFRISHSGMCGTGALDVLWRSPFIGPQETPSAAEIGLGHNGNHYDAQAGHE